MSRRKHHHHRLEMIEAAIRIAIEKHGGRADDKQVLAVLEALHPLELAAEMNEDARRQRLNEIRQITNRLSGEGLEAGRNKKESTDYFKQRDLFWPDDAPGMPRTFVRVLRPGQSDVTSYFATATPREVDRAAKRKIKIGEDTVAVGRIEELQANYLMQEDHAQLDEEIFEIQERRRPSDDESEQETQGERT